MWTFLERPGSSLQAKAFELSSTLFVAISVMGLSFGTIPEFQIIQYMPPGNETGNNLGFCTFIKAQSNDFSLVVFWKCGAT